MFWLNLLYVCMWLSLVNCKVWTCDEPQEQMCFCWVNRNNSAIKHTCGISHYMIEKHRAIFRAFQLSWLLRILCICSEWWVGMTLASRQLFVLHYTPVWRFWRADVAFISLFMCGVYTSWGTLSVDAVIDFSWKFQLCLKCYNVLFIKEQRKHSEELLCDLGKKKAFWLDDESGSLAHAMPKSKLGDHEHWTHTLIYGNYRLFRGKFVRVCVYLITPPIPLYGEICVGLLKMFKWIRA